MAEIRYNIKENRVENELPVQSDDDIFNFNFIYSDNVAAGNKNFILKVELTEDKREELGLKNALSNEKELVFSWAAAEVEKMPIHLNVTKEEYNSIVPNNNIIYFITDVKPIIEEINPTTIDIQKWESINNAINLIQTVELILKSQSK